MERRENGASPASKHKQRSFASLNNVLSKLVAKLGLDKRLKENALFGLWPVIIGDFFASQSRPLFIDSDHNLVVSVKDAAVGQELSLMKRDIVLRLKRAASALGITVTGVRFDLKHYHNSVNSDKDLPGLDTPERTAQLPVPTDQELAEIDLSTEELGQLALVAQELSEIKTTRENALVQEINLTTRMAALCEREIRLRKWRLIHGYPKCANCAEPVAMLHGPRQLCTECFYKTLSHF